MTVSPTVELTFSDLHPSSLQVLDGRRLGDARSAMDAALMSYRLLVVNHVKTELAKKADVTGQQLISLLDEATTLFLPRYSKIVGPYVAQAYVAAYRRANAGDVPVEVIYALAQQHTERVGAYFAQSSADASLSGFNSYVNRKLAAKAAAAKVLDSYGLTKRQTNGLVAMQVDPAVTSARPRDLKERVNSYISRSLRRRLKLFDDQELRNIENQAIQTAWIWLAQHGRIHPGAQKVWITARDERTCPQCAPMHNQRVGVNEQFVLPNKVKVYVPGLHPNCRCKALLLDTITPAKLSISNSKSGVSKADWDAKEHPRGGDPKNRGRFSTYARTMERDEDSVAAGLMRATAARTEQKLAPEVPRPAPVARPLEPIGATGLLPVLGPAEPLAPVITSLEPIVEQRAALAPIASDVSVIEAKLAPLSTTTVSQTLTPIKALTPLPPVSDLAPESGITPLDPSRGWYYAAVSAGDPEVPHDWDYTLNNRDFHSFSLATVQRQADEMLLERQNAVFWRIIDNSPDEDGILVMDESGEFHGWLTEDDLRGVIDYASDPVRYRVKGSYEGVRVHLFDHYEEEFEPDGNISYEEIARQLHLQPSDFRPYILAIRDGHADVDLTKHIKPGHVRLSGSFVQTDDGTTPDGEVLVRYLRPNIHRGGVPWPNG